MGNEVVSKEDEAMAATLGGKIALAATLGREAASEPRYWRHPWPEVSFDRAVKCFGILDFCLNTIQQSVLGDEKISREIEKYMNLPSFMDAGGVKDILSEHAANVMEAVDKSLDDKANHDVFIRGMKELDTLQARRTAVLWRPALQRYMDALPRMISQQGQVTTHI